MTIAEALQAAARYVEEHKGALIWSGSELPCEDEKARVIAEVSALGHELDSLAAASETSRVYRREVEVVVGELQRRDLILPTEIAQSIDHAFDGAVTAPKAASARRRPRQADERTVAGRPPAI